MITNTKLNNRMSIEALDEGNSLKGMSTIVYFTASRLKIKVSIIIEPIETSVGNITVGMIKLMICVVVSSACCPVNAVEMIITTR